MDARQQLQNKTNLDESALETALKRADDLDRQFKAATQQAAAATQRAENLDKDLTALRAENERLKKPSAQPSAANPATQAVNAEAAAPSAPPRVSPKDGFPYINPKDGSNYVWIPPGGFTMGCSPGDTECFPDEKPPHREQIVKGFWLGQTEVTQAAWKKVMGGDNPSHFKGDTLPVEQVDWTEAKNYCQAIDGRLPTETEWEYSARAGNTASRYGNLDTVSWNSENSERKTHPVGQKLANAFGLNDMLGNVWEWTSTDWAAYRGGKIDTCMGCRVFRGGSWVVSSRGVRVSFRDRDEPTYRYNYVGFRCAGEFR